MAAVALPPLIYQIRDDANCGMHGRPAFGIRLDNQAFDATLPHLFHNALDFIVQCSATQPYWVLVRCTNGLGFRV
jgi:hypothetical protein